MNIAEYMQSLGKQAREASRQLAQAATEVKNAALLATAEELDKQRATLLAANNEDMKAGATRQLDAALLDRLELNDERIDARSEEHTSELQSRPHLVCRLLLEKKKKKKTDITKVAIIISRK